jgi:hypothetical protein
VEGKQVGEKEGRVSGTLGEVAEIGSIVMYVGKAMSHCLQRSMRMGQSGRTLLGKPTQVLEKVRGKEDGSWSCRGSGRGDDAGDGRAAVNAVRSSGNAVCLRAGEAKQQVAQNQQYPSSVAHFTAQ